MRPSLSVVQPRQREFVKVLKKVSRMRANVQLQSDWLARQCSVLRESNARVNRPVENWRSRQVPSRHKIKVLFPPDKSGLEAEVRAVRQSN